jgi:predicted enzyme related to lactoylglutathione lyase
MTTDHPKALAFYQRLFGWEKTSEMDMGGGNMYVLYGKGQKMYGGMFNRMPEMGSMPPFWLCYILVKDVHKAVETATRRGATVVREPMPIPGGMIAILADPQGAGFAVHHMDVPAEASRAPAKKTAKKTAASRPKRAAARKAKKATARKPARKTSAKARGGKRPKTKKAARTSGKRSPARKTARKRGARKVRGRAARRRR